MQARKVTSHVTQNQTKTLYFKIIINLLIKQVGQASFSADILTSLTIL